MPVRTVAFFPLEWLCRVQIYWDKTVVLTSQPPIKKSNRNIKWNKQKHCQTSRSSSNNETTLIEIFDNDRHMIVTMPYEDQRQWRMTWCRKRMHDEIQYRVHAFHKKTCTPSGSSGRTLTLIRSTLQKFTWLKDNIIEENFNISFQTKRTSKLMKPFDFQWRRMIHVDKKVIERH